VVLSSMLENGFRDHSVDPLGAMDDLRDVIIPHVVLRYPYPYLGRTSYFNPGDDVPWLVAARAGHGEMRSRLGLAPLPPAKNIRFKSTRS
jgi:hypothetical protein